MGNAFMRFFEPLTESWAVDLLAVVTLALCLAVVVVPRLFPRPRAAAAAAGVSPLWLLPFAVAVIASLLQLPLRPHTSTLVDYLPLVLAALQVVASGWVIYRHRRWPWLAVPLAAVLLLWPGIALATLALAVIGS